MKTGHKNFAFIWKKRNKSVKMEQLWGSGGVGNTTPAHPARVESAGFNQNALRNPSAVQDGGTSDPQPHPTPAPTPQQLMS